MNDLTSLLQHGGSAWLFLPTAIVLGALHGLEPGHSKTMMAAFIIAVRGTLGQAVLLGLAATVSHTAVVWLVALGGLYFGQRWDAEASEPILQLVSAAIIVGVGAWMVWRTSRHQAACFHDHGDAAHGHGHGHAHDDHAHDDHAHDHDHARAHGPATHAHGTACAHSGDHDHDHAPAPAASADDPHGHGADIQRRFAGRHVTTAQILMFGLTGGLIPCPASITVLLLCLQLKRLALGATLVLGFSIGLAATMVASGVVAAIGVKHLSKRADASGRLSALAAKAPYLSGGLILLVGAVLAWQALRAMG
ncbi:MAG: nickel/cobalt efflux transporter [Burkholderiaceae bacterium]